MAVVRDYAQPNPNLTMTARVELALLNCKACQRFPAYSADKRNEPQYYSFNLRCNIPWDSGFRACPMECTDDRDPQKTAQPCISQ